MALIVIDPGLSTTVQDAGRPGYREWGVPLGGAFDRGSAALANALLGNPLGCAVLEFTLFGGRYEADCATALALAGAPMEANILGPNSSSRSLLLPASFSLQAGEHLILGRNVGGARTYLAVQGGWQTALQLGSRSSEQRLRSGDILPAGPGTIPARGWASLRGDHRPTSHSASSRALTARFLGSSTKHFGWTTGFESVRRVTGWACGSRVIRRR